MYLLLAFTADAVLGGLSHQKATLGYRALCSGARRVAFSSQVGKRHLPDGSSSQTTAAHKPQKNPQREQRANLEMRSFVEAVQLLETRLLTLEEWID
jgi:hypothetical protein